MNHAALLSTGLLTQTAKHGEELDDAVFRIAATFPLRVFFSERYMITGDEFYGFEPNGFMQRLVEETGVSHVWQPVPTTVSEETRYLSASVELGLGGENAKFRREARQIVWEVWNRLTDLDQFGGDRLNKNSLRHVAMIFADFLIDNFDLFRQLEDKLKTCRAEQWPVVRELEEKARSGFWSRKF